VFHRARRCMEARRATRNTTTYCVHPSKNTASIPHPIGRWQSPGMTLFHPRLKPQIADLAQVEGDTVLSFARNCLVCGSWAGRWAVSRLLGTLLVQFRTIRALECTARSLYSFPCNAIGSARGSMSRACCGRLGDSGHRLRQYAVKYVRSESLYSTSLGTLYPMLVVRAAQPRHAADGLGCSSCRARSAGARGMTSIPRIANISPSSVLEGHGWSARAIHTQSHLVTCSG
jgi:hypothetical protein